MAKPLLPGEGMAFGMSYGELVQRLRSDLQLDASTDVLPGSTVAALSSDTLTHKLGPWTAPTLLNAWANVGAGNEPAGYLKDPLGFVHLRGLVIGGANATVAFVLPVGFRPAAQAQYSAAPGGGIGLVLFAANGNVTINWTVAANMSFAGITFLAEN